MKPTLILEGLREGLRDRAKEDLRGLLRGLRQGSVAVLDSGLGPVFGQARQAARRSADCPPVVALSIGGSSLKLALVERAGGRFRVLHLAGCEHPATPRPFEDFLEDWLRCQPLLLARWRAGPPCAVAASVAVLFSGEVPFHPSKIPHLLGLVARHADADPDAYRLPPKLRAVFARLDLPVMAVRCASDGVLAHLGGVASGDSDGRRTALLVCGTGLATATGADFLLCGMPPLLAGHSPDWFPGSLTEFGQYQYLIAGKGQYRLFAHWLARLAEESGLPLPEGYVERYFHHSRDTVNVCRLWAATAGEEPPPCWWALPQPLRQPAGELAAVAMEQGLGCLANCVAASLAHDLRRDGPADHAHDLYLEGSIARDPRLRAGLTRRLPEVLSQTAVFEEAGYPVPPLPHLSPEPPEMTDPSSPAGAPRPDLTLLGTAYLAMAQAGKEAA